MKPRRLIAIVPALAMLLAAACATGPRVHSLHDPAADFGRFTTYDFAPEASAGDEKYRSFLTQYLEQAIAREMETRGYRRSDNPDLLVNFNVSTREKLQVRDAPARLSPFYRPYPFYYSYRFGFYDPWPYYAYETRVVQYTEGTLNIDLINAAQKQLVWEGVAVGRVHEDRENMREHVNEVVASVFEKYPFVAGRAEPVIPGKE